MAKLFDLLIPDKLVDKTLEGIFSKPSLVIHTIWFIFWFVGGADVSLLTNIVSLEAIYIGILIGIQQFRHRDTIREIKHHLTKGKVK